MNITQIQAKFADTLNSANNTHVRVTQCWDDRWCVSGVDGDAQKASAWLVKHLQATVVESVYDEELAETFVYLQFP